MSVTVTPTSTAKPNRMDRRREKTRQLLMCAAIDLILEKGFDETTTDEITETADVGRRTFYNHFDNKKDCVKAAVGERFAHYASESIPVAEKHEDQAIALTISAMAVFNRVSSDPITERLTMYPRLLIDAIRESQRDFITPTVINGVEQERFSSSLPLEAVDALISWGFVGLVLENIAQPDSDDHSTVWAHYLLQNLGVKQEDIGSIIDTARDNTAT